jgi:hypothetical protein
MLSTRPLFMFDDVTVESGPLKEGMFRCRSFATSVCHTRNWITEIHEIDDSGPIPLVTRCVARWHARFMHPPIVNMWMRQRGLECVAWHETGVNWTEFTAQPKPAECRAVIV